MSGVRRAKKSTINIIRVVEGSLSDSWTISKLRTIDEVVCKESMKITRRLQETKRWRQKRSFTKIFAMEKWRAWLLFRSLFSLSSWVISGSLRMRDLIAFSKGLVCSPYSFFWVAFLCFLCWVAYLWTDDSSMAGLEVRKWGLFCFREALFLNILRGSERAFFLESFEFRVVSAIKVSNFM